MKSAVLVIDVQTVLFDPKPHPYEAQQVLNRINQITDWARKRATPVIFIQHEQDNSTIEFNTAGWRLQADLTADKNDHFVRKTTPDSFLRTDLASLLEELDVNHLLVCGYATEFCVDTTIRRAAGLGYRVTLISDAHTTHDKEHATGEQIRLHHNETLPNISSFGVKIDTVTTRELV